MYAGPTTEAVSVPKSKMSFGELVLEVIYRLGFIHLGKFAAVAWYYVLTQILKGQHVQLQINSWMWSRVLPNVKWRWDHLLSADWAHGGVLYVMSTTQWNTDRHAGRPYIEGLAGLLLYLLISFDPIKYEAKAHRTRKIRHGRFALILTRIDLVLERIHITVVWLDKNIWAKLPLVPSRYKEVTLLQQFALPFLVFFVAVLVAIPGFLWVIPLFTHTLHMSWLAPTINSNANLAAKVYGEGVMAIILGVLAGFLVKRMVQPVMNHDMRFICSWWVGKGHKAHWFMPRGMRKYIKSLYAERTDAVAYHRQLTLEMGVIFTMFVTVTAVFLFISFVIGWLILNYVA